MGQLLLIKNRKVALHGAPFIRGDTPDLPVDPRNTILPRSHRSTSDFESPDWKPVLTNATPAPPTGPYHRPSRPPPLLASFESCGCWCSLLACAARFAGRILLRKLQNPDFAMTKNLWVTIFLYGLLLLALGGYMIVFVLLAMRRNQEQLHIETIGAFVNFIAVAIVDILTAAGLIWKLWTMRSSFAQTNTFLNRVMVGAVQTGSLTAMCSLLILATFVSNPNNAVSAFFLYQFASLYTLTLLFNFNLRQAGRSTTSKTSESRHGNINILLGEGIRTPPPTFIRTLLLIWSLVDATNRRLDDLEEIKHNPNGSDVGDHGARNVMVKMKN
ncbi:hypothetical protein C8R47DRAFT_1218301 [Mycena vitilis]|nr:hypothetical protein C8R47DRAFT_1218301 [Mycena vitilis]